MLDLSDQRLPIERYLLTARQYGEVVQAQQVLASRCVARYGLTFAPPSSSGGQAGTGDGNDTPANTVRRYGIADPVAAARYGYHLPDSERPKPGDGEPKQPAPVLLVLTGTADGNSDPRSPAAQATSYRGRRVPAGGCLAEAARQLGSRSGALDDAQLAREVNDSSFERTMSQPDAARAIRSWSACMKAAGYGYADPTQPPGTRLMEMGKASAEELAIATADVTCKRRTNLVGYWFTAEQGYQEAAVQQHAAEFAQIQAELQAMIKRAHEVLTPKFHA
jgi:hypothetical protein